MVREEYLKKIIIDELPEYTPWIERLLHLKPFKKPVRNLAKIDAEYDKDKYAKLSAYYKEHPDVAITDIMEQESSPSSDTACFSRKGELFLTTVANFRKLQDKILIDALAEPVSKTRVVVELGCGYGYNLSVLRNAFPNRLWLGGEYSKNAIELASHLFANCKDVSIQPFNWYDDTWAILENLQEKTLIFTRHSIEQLPQTKSIAPTFCKYKDKIEEVIHLEPVYEFIDKQTTLGIMRQAYTLINDYNTDLLTTLKNMRVQILNTDTDLIGGNPLNPTSLIQWKFAEE
jgi:hypothetical protein